MRESPSFVDHQNVTIYPVTINNNLSHISSKYQCDLCNISVMIYNGMCNNTKIDKTGWKIWKKSKELYILNVNDILNDFLTFFLLLNMSFYIFPNPPLPVYQIFTRRGNNQDKYNPGITTIEVYKLFTTTTLSALQ